MKKLMTIKSVATLAVACLLSTAAFAQPPTFPRADTGMFGASAGQTVRVNAVHVGDLNTLPIEAEMMLLDDSGAVLAQGTKVLAPSQATFIDFTVPMRDRTQLRALVNLTGGDISYLKVSVELIESETGRTTLFIRAENLEL